jgi:non-canonical purine NTP pyrophosphatase (RdgB/HAM1 family)
MNVTFITGNEHKANFMAKFLNYPVKRQKIELDEIQSLDVLEVIDHKVKQAYEIVKSPVLVEDVGLYFNAMGRLPGVFTRWFLEEIGNEGMCRVLNAYSDRSAVAKVCLAYYDGSLLKIFEGEVRGHISDKPYGDDRFGWNCIFIPTGADKTYGQMDGEETERFSLRTTTVYPQIKKFLLSLDKA